MLDVDWLFLQFSVRRLSGLDRSNQHGLLGWILLQVGHVGGGVGDALFVAHPWELPRSSINIAAPYKLCRVCMCMDVVPCIKVLSPTLNHIFNIASSGLLKREYKIL